MNHVQLMKYWNRLHTLNKDRVLYKIYEELINLDLQGYRTWVTKARDILNLIDKPHMYNSIRTHGADLFPGSLIKEYVKDYESKWRLSINNSTENPKLRTYNLFKTDLKQEKYITYIRNRNYLKAISQFRTSSHNLFIEIGRHTIPVTPLENRICKFCSTSEIDDEVHMLIDCPFHSQERTVFFDKIKGEIVLNNAHSIETFRKIMTCDLHFTLNALGKYLHTGFYKREQLSETGMEL